MVELAKEILSGHTSDRRNANVVVRHLLFLLAQSQRRQHLSHLNSVISAILGLSDENFKRSRHRNAECHAPSSDHERQLNESDRFTYSTWTHPKRALRPLKPPIAKQYLRLVNFTSREANQRFRNPGSFVLFWRLAIFLVRLLR